MTRAVIGIADNIAVYMLANLFNIINILVDSNIVFMFYIEVFSTYLQSLPPQPLAQLHTSPLPHFLEYQICNFLQQEKRERMKGGERLGGEQEGKEDTPRPMLALQLFGQPQVPGKSMPMFCSSN